MSDPITQGPHHIGLTVPNLAETRNFFIDTLGFEQVGEVPDYPAVFLSDQTSMITLWQAENPSTATPFDRRRNVGLHHIAMKVDPGKLDGLHQSLLQTPGVQIEFAPEPLGQTPLRHMMCAIPGGVRMEFIGTAD